MSDEASLGVWDARFLDLARHVASWSQDESTKVGCVIADLSANIVLATGFNGLPRGCANAPDRAARPAKYKWTEHAERNAIYNAARAGVSVEGACMFIPWFPCTDCARAIVQSGISRLVALMPDLADARWGADFEIALGMFAEAGVEVVYA